MKKPTNIGDKTTMQRAFLAKAGPNADVMRQMMDCAEDLYFYMKDAKGHIMALNRSNCELCNIRDEEDAIGRTSADIFPQSFAKDYMDLDREVLESGEPILDRITEYPADKSFRLMKSNVWPLKDGRGRVIGTARVYRVISAEDAKMNRYGRMRKVAAFIAENYDRRLSLADLADKAKSDVRMASEQALQATRKDIENILTDSIVKEGTEKAPALVEVKEKGTEKSPAPADAYWRPCSS